MNLRQLKDEHSGLFFVLLCLVIFIIYAIFNNYRFASKGVVTIAKVLKYESATSGSNLYLTVFYKGRTYENVANAMCMKCIGKYFFVQIVRDDPEGDIRFLGDSVPDCILENPIPFDGWGSVPECR